jgi:hypothetical protein
VRTRFNESKEEVMGKKKPAKFAGFTIGIKIN